MFDPSKGLEAERLLDEATARIDGLADSRGHDPISRSCSRSLTTAPR